MEITPSCMFGFPTTWAARKGTSVISAIEQNNSVSAVMDHYVINPLIPDNKKLLKEIKAGNALLRSLSL